MATFICASSVPLGSAGTPLRSVCAPDECTLVDAYWPSLGLVVECDAWRYHRAGNQFESDRLRDQHLTTAGHHVMRITARPIDHMRYALVARVVTTIAHLGTQPASPY